MSNLGRVIKFTNIDKEDFEHAFGGQPFLVKAGESRVFPYDLAEHLAKHLARKILISGDKGKSIYDPTDPTGGTGKTLATEEQEVILMNKIMAEEFAVEEDKPKTEAELLRDRIAKLEALLLGDKKGEEVKEEIVTKDGVYADKAEVIEELKKRGIAFDARKNKSDLEKLLDAGVTS